MNSPTPQNVVYWGWFRLALGVLQMSCSAYAVFLIFWLGLEPVTWGFIAAAIGLTALSRLLFRGRRNVDLEQEENKR